MRPELSEIRVLRCVDRAPQLHEPRPLVVMLGWMGSTPKHVDKYAALYLRESVGADVVAVCAPIKAMFGSARRKAELCSRILGAVGELADASSASAGAGAAPRPLLVHLFSNGGVSLYRCLAPQLLAHRARTATYNYIGTVWDSAPGYMTIASGVRAFSAAIGLPQWLVCLLMLPWFLCSCCVGESPERNWNALLHDPIMLPSLYLFSDADNLISSVYIEQLIAVRRRAGVEITERKFANSPHVQHLRSSPEGYVAALDQWMESVLRGAQRAAQR